MADKLSLMPMNVMDTPPLTGTDKRSYVATLATQDNPKSSVCDVFNDMDMAYLLAAAPAMLAVLIQARDAMSYPICKPADLPKAGMAMSDAIDGIGTVLATIPVKFLKECP